MVKKLFGRKLGMTQHFLEEGKSVPVTVLKIGPCVVTQKKTAEKEGYNAIQVGYEPKKESRVKKPLRGHFKAAGERYFEHLNEIRIDDPETFELGQEIKSDIFNVNDIIEPAKTREWLINMLQYHYDYQTGGIGEHLMHCWPTSF